MPGLSHRAEDTKTVAEFFDAQWRAYEKIVEANLLGHRELFAAARDLLRARCAIAGNPPYSLLDLGCGDCRYARQLVEDTSLAAYHGIDLSEVALSAARQRMDGLPCTFEAGNAFKAIAVTSAQYDVVLASYSMHHLSQSEKSAFLCDLLNCLRPGGAFMLIDLVLHDGTSRDQGIKDFIENARRQWTVLTPQEMDLAAAHIDQADFPETAGWLRDRGLAAGFERVETVCLAGGGRTRLMVFDRRPPDA